MSREAPVTAVQAALRRRRKWFAPLTILLAIVFLVGIVATVLGAVVLAQLFRNKTPYYAGIVEHFKYGSIGANNETNGIPYRIWMALPALFPEAFEGRDDYSAFGFLYENDEKGRRRDLPIGIARGEIAGVDVVWFNCATCHTGTVYDPVTARRTIVPGMPSNNFNLYAFIRFLLDAGADERLSSDALIKAMASTGGRLGWLDEAIYRWYVIPNLREGLVVRRSRLRELLAEQPAWGPGRVDTFSPYKLVLGDVPLASLDPSEIYGTADFPAIFNQKPREGMHLHWDGNNTSLGERNLSAALGAGVTADSLDRGGYAAIQRVAGWLGGLQPPASPYTPDGGAVARGRDLYMVSCAPCHGYQGEDGYVFAGEFIGKVQPIAELGTDRGRLDSYTARFRDYQLGNFFKGTPYAFRLFAKTDGYANLPLDGLWLRAPYLHNGSVPTLADLLLVPERRPKAFQRGSDVLDRERGGFVSPPCDAAAPPSSGTICFDTSLPGNGNGGHLYGTQLADPERQDLLAYLLTF